VTRYAGTSSPIADSFGTLQRHGGLAWRHAHTDTGGQRRANTAAASTQTAVGKFEIDRGSAPYFPPEDAEIDLGLLLAQSPAQLLECGWALLGVAKSTRVKRPAATVFDAVSAVMELMFQCGGLDTSLEFSNPPLIGCL
jgi:hypothetical protein